MLSFPEEHETYRWVYAIMFFMVQFEALLAAVGLGI